MATSGTVSTTVFLVQDIIDHAFRRCKIPPQKITVEYILTAKDLLYLYLSTLVSRGIKLWNVDKTILPLYEQTSRVPTPLGVVDVLNCNLRTSTRHVTGTQTSSEGTAANAFDGDLATACSQSTVDGTITIEFDAAISIPTYGIMPAVTDTWSFVIEGSNDGITYTEIYAGSDVEVTEDNWIWFDVEGVPEYAYYQLRGTDATILDVVELVYQNNPREIPMYALNRDDYSDLPDKTRQGRPTQYWWDKQRTQGVIQLWPSVQFQYTFAQLTCYTQRYIQDVGSVTNELEVPQRWYLSIVCSLAEQLGREINEVDTTLIPVLERDALKENSKAWDGETDSSNTFIRPNLAPYTR